MPFPDGAEFLTVDPTEVGAIAAEIDRLIFDQAAPRKALQMIRALPEAQQKHLSLRLLRVSALALVGNGDQATEALLNLAGRSPPHSHLCHSVRLFLQDMGAIPARPDLAKIDDFHRSYDTAPSIDALPPTPIEQKNVDRLIALVRHLHPNLKIDQQSWTNRLEIGLSRGTQMARLLQGGPINARLPCHSPEAQAERMRIMLGTRLEGFEQITRHLDSGRSVVLIMAHAGSSEMFIHKLVADLAHPYSLVGNGLRGGMNRGEVLEVFLGLGFAVTSHPDDYSVGTDNANMSLHFAKLCKMLRRGPARLVCIFPDGNVGSEFLEGELGPYRLPIGPGAAALAWFGKAAMFTARSEWRGNDVVVVPRELPGVGPADSLDDVRSHLATDYMGLWRDILGNDPINFGPRSGYWKTFVAD